MMQSIMSWIEHSGLHDVLIDSAWAFPAFEIVHFIGLVLLFGSVAAVDLRLLGVGASIPVSAVLRFLPVAALGFALNAISGTMFLFSDPYRYFPNVAFRLKILAIVLAGLNAAWFMFVAGSERQGNGTPRAVEKALAASSLLLWLGVIVLGRAIPYLE